MTIELITSEVLKLDRLERIALVQLVLDSIAQEEMAGHASKDESVSAMPASHEQEIKNRLAMFKEGKMKTTPAEKVMEKLTKKHGL